MTRCAGRGASASSKITAYREPRRAAEGSTRRWRPCARVIYKLDRLGRSVAHLAELLRLFEERSIHLCSLSEGINTETTGGKLVYHVFSAVAEFQRDLIRENTLAGLEAARERGKRPGRPRKLSPGQAREAARFIRQDGMSIAATARHYAVSPATVWRAMDKRAA